MLRKKNVVGKFVEFFGPGLPRRRWPTARPSRTWLPEYGATCGIFPVDVETLRYLEVTGRSSERWRWWKRYYKEQGMFHDANTPEASYTDVLELDLAKVEPSLAGPTRPQDRVPLTNMKPAFARSVRQN